MSPSRASPSRSHAAKARRRVARARKLEAAATVATLAPSPRARAIAEAVGGQGTRRSPRRSTSRRGRSRKGARAWISRSSGCWRAAGWMRAEIAGDPAELFGAAEAAEVRRALDHAGALPSPGEEQGGVEAGDPASDDQGLRAGGAHSMRPRPGLIERAA